jgi:exonuclease SbcD
MSQSEPVRALHFADIHIGMENFGQIDPATGVNQRVLDFIKRMGDVVDYALENDADLVLFSGDAFKTRDPNPTYQREFAHQIMRLTSANITTVLLVGNHDMPVIDKRASSVDIYRTLSVPNVIVGHKEELHSINTKRGIVQIATVPWPIRSRLLQDDDLRSSNIEELDRALEAIMEQELTHLSESVNPALPAVLMGHFTVAGSKWGSERAVMIGRDTVVSLGALNNPAWDYVALGHIHKHQDVNAGRYPSVVYSGSLERIDFGEELEPKGFCWVELSRGHTTWRFVPVKARRFVTIDVDASDDGETPTEAVLRAIDRTAIEDAVVRVKVKLLQSQEPFLKPKDIEKALKTARFVVGIGKDIKRDNRTRIGIEKAESMTDVELLHAYLVSKGASANHINELMSVAKEFLDRK